MSELIDESCSACRVGAPQVGEKESRELLLQIPDWAIVTLKEIPQLKREYKFRNFVDALRFCNNVADMAESLNHHPEITFGWGYARLIWYTHK
ncbi:MAG: 4a-hydroxytetrahydrobiopterin dehydratase, partial [Oceanospirillaceae bacterium]|nr:4a-hydroxytetrahydrobiopterin dehydratase [Oceanospirillaceae bacterium]